MKFYALHKFNTVVERGEFDYTNLPKIYAIAILAKNILPTKPFHTIANLRSEQGEIIDSQMTFITLELAKFDKPVAEIESDLDKLIYTMKTLHTAQPTEYPAFWNEEWLRRAIEELDTRRMSPEERAYFARVTAANAEAVKAEKQRIEEVKVEAIQNALREGLAIDLIARINGVSRDFVLSVQKGL